MVCFRVPAGCGGRFTALRGSIHSPNYPQNYDHDSDCTWRITVDRHHSVRLTFADFDVEPHNNCSYDYVAVRLANGIINFFLSVNIVPSSD